MDTIISASLLAADFGHLADDISRAGKARSDWLHYDVMDGLFVPSISFGEPVLKSVSEAADIPLDVHLMICDPIRYIDRYADLGAEYITFHLEAADDPLAVIEKIHSRGVKAGLSLKPATAGEAVFPYLKDIDMVLVMTVEPGFGGQSFMPDMLDKISLVRQEIGRLGLNTLVEVDGGINGETAPLVRESGANVLVSGSYIFGAADMKRAVSSLR